MKRLSITSGKASFDMVPSGIYEPPFQIVEEGAGKERSEVMYPPPETLGVLRARDVTGPDADRIRTFVAELSVSDSKDFMVSAPGLKKVVSGRIENCDVKDRSDGLFSAEIIISSPLEHETEGAV